MKKIILSALIPMVVATSAVFGTTMISYDNGPVPGDAVSPSAVDPNAHINLFTSGSTSSTSMTIGTGGGTFSLDTYIQFTGFTSKGLSYWLEASTVNSFNTHLTLNSESYFQNWTQNQPVNNNVFATTTGVDSGFQRETQDLGSTDGGDPLKDLGAGTFKVSTLNFTLSGGLTPGTYTLQLTTLSPVISEISDNQSTPQDHAVATAVYTITVVPEPATLSLLGLGSLGSFGLTMLRARRRKA